MSEKPIRQTRPVTPPEIDQQISDASGRIVGNVAGNRGLQIRFETYEQARQVKKPFSDAFIDNALNKYRSIKKYLDNVEATPSDQAILADSRRIARLYVKTTRMICDNFRIILRDSDVSPQHKTEVLQGALKDFKQKVSQQVPVASTAIVDWFNDVPDKKYPMAALEYRQGLVVDGVDLLDAGGNGLKGLRPNFKIQRQYGTTFIMAYTDRRVREKLAGSSRDYSRRIYLNPDMEATPEIFEQLLRAANRANISLQLKMLQRVTDGGLFQKPQTDGLRGDGIVMYVHSGDIDDVLGMTIAIAKTNPEAFRGRQTSRIPQNVAEGIAIGDEPLAAGESLTSHRANILEYVAQKTRESGKKGAEARSYFRAMFSRVAIANQVDPNNLAFDKLQK